MRKRKTCPALRVPMFPKDTNPSGNIFGGIIMSHIDVAGGYAAKQICSNRVVTAGVEKIDFARPVFVGDMLTCWAEVVSIGRTSLKTRVEVEVERDGQVIQVTEALLTFVAVDKNERPIPLTLRKGYRRCQGGKGFTTSNGKRRRRRRGRRSNQQSGGCCGQG